MEPDLTSTAVRQPKSSFVQTTQRPSKVRLSCWWVVGWWIMFVLLLGICCELSTLNEYIAGLYRVLIGGL